jgi:thiol-disulfide isomerase/thioredoxin
MLLFLFVNGASAQTDEFEYGLSPVYGTPRSPIIDLEGLSGKRYRLSDYTGSVVLVNFWATWCPPCVQEMPTLQELADLLGDEDFEILAVNLGEEKKQIDEFLKKFNPALDFPILFAREQSITVDWKIKGLPATYIVDTQGRWVYQALGPRDYAHEHIVSQLRQLMGK